MSTDTNKPLSLGFRGAGLIKSFEKLSVVAYLPTPNDVPTIGYGHTRGVRMGDVTDERNADLMFLEDAMWAEEAIRKTGAILTQSMFDALVSLVFNVGPSCIAEDSTIGGNLPSREFPGNDGGYYRAWAGFALWRKQSGRDLLGLARRRAREMALFLEDGIPT